MDGSVLAAVSGFAMGFLGSIPLTGPIALFVFHRSLQGSYKRGVAMGVGGTLGESIYCALAVAGIGALVEQYPMASAGLKLMSALVLVIFGLYFLVAPPNRLEVESPDEESESLTWQADLLKGFTISAFNPILLLNWTAAIAIAYSTLGVRFDLVAGIAFVVAAAVGVAGWFSLLVLLLSHFKQRIPERFVDWIQRAMGAIVLVGAALPIHDVLNSLADFQMW